MDNNEYNNEPVYYCQRCLSLRVKIFNSQDYCDDCGGTDILTTDIDTWKDLYKERYGEEFYI